MKAAQIYIRNTESYLDVKQDGDFPFVLSKSVAEIQDVQKRNKNYSKTFKVAATPANIQALGYPHVLGTDLDAINVYKQSAYVIVNGNVIDEGYIYIMKAVREIEVLEFECQFIGSNEAWVVGLQNIRMNQIFQDSAGSGLEVAYTDNDIVSRYIANPRTMADPSYVYINPYIYQFSDGFAENDTQDSEYNGSSRNAVYTDFWPAFRVDYLVDAIFGTANGPLIKDYLATQGITFDAFQLDSDFLTDNATHGFWDNIYYSDRSEESYSTTFGSNNYWGLFLPSQMTALDFFMKLVKTFNLVFDFDGITLKVEPRLEWTSWDGNTYDGFYGATSVDWSNKIAKEQSIEYSTTNYKRQVRISYGTDSYPFTPSMYPFYTDDKVNQPEVRYIIDLNNNLEEGVTDIKLPFNTSPSKFYQPKFDYKRHKPKDFSPLSGEELDETSITWEPEVGYSDRLFVFKGGAKPMGVRFYNDFDGSSNGVEREINLHDPRWRDWIYEKQDGTEVTNTGYPYIYNCMTVNPFDGQAWSLVADPSEGFETGYYALPSNYDDIDNVDPVGPTTTFGTSGSTPMTGITPVDPDDINLGIYASNSVNMVDGLYERFWKSTLDHLVTTKTLITKVRLTRNEFVTLDMSAYYTALGQRFILNAVKDFDPTLDEQMVEVELLSVDFVRSSELTEAPVGTLLLDQYGEDVQAAYSLRKLRTDYTGASIRVRRTPDNTEQDIGFDSDGNLDESALTTFVGSGSAHVQTWYDQSTNANHAVQNTSGQQPHIVYNGTIKTHGGKPAVTQDSDLGNPSNQFLDLTSTVNAVHNFIVFYQPAVGGGRAYYAESASRALKHDGFRIDYEDGVNTRIDGSTNIRTDYVLSEVKVLSGTATSIINGSTDASGTANVLQLEALMGYPTAGGGIVARMQEMIFFSADKSSVASDIETDINTHYTIF
jgi:hypothetical protein